ncbi:hypothetical protein NDU88_006084 [Pleurodeles waltl]|uniref:Uncharacterized protein n=1 Tax=Pleurodeles waltl TaxID=8319 RepID=A0AAV7TXF5_PLEWA|nr:hypothetical protein NDU88_006084 [Pleurodeles waltl]
MGAAVMCLPRRWNPSHTSTLANGRLRHRLLQEPRPVPGTRAVRRCSPVARAGKLQQPRGRHGITPLGSSGGRQRSGIRPTAFEELGALGTCGRCVCVLDVYSAFHRPPPPYVRRAPCIQCEFRFCTDRPPCEAAPVPRAIVCCSKSDASYAGCPRSDLGPAYCPSNPRAEGECAALPLRHFYSSQKGAQQCHRQRPTAHPALQGNGALNREALIDPEHCTNTVFKRLGGSSYRQKYLSGCSTWYTALNGAAVCLMGVVPALVCHYRNEPILSLVSRIAVVYVAVY